MTEEEMDEALKCNTVLRTEIGKEARLVLKLAGGMYPFVGLVDGYGVEIMWQFSRGGRSSDSLDRAFDLSIPSASPAVLSGWDDVWMRAQAH
jgi:hypothetical protein